MATYELDDVLSKATFDIDGFREHNEVITFTLDDMICNSSNREIVDCLDTLIGEF